VHAAHLTAPFATVCPLPVIILKISKYVSELFLASYPARKATKVKLFPCHTERYLQVERIYQKSVFTESPKQPK
jgi:hypothetical protein